LNHVALIAKRYREFADQYFRRARRANVDLERDRLLETAIGWLEAARRTEAAARATREPRSLRVDGDNDKNTNDG
jgi:hypothetical protein